MAGMSKLASKLSSRNCILFAAGVAAVWISAKQFGPSNKRRKELPIVISDRSLAKKDRAAIDSVFLKQLQRILKIILPGWYSTEGLYMILVAVVLAARTYCDVWMIQNGTSIESAIIGRNVDLFRVHLFRFIYAMPAISLVNNTLKVDDMILCDGNYGLGAYGMDSVHNREHERSRYGLNQLKLRFRTRLSYYLFQKYLRGFTYYKMSNLDNRIANADHLLTQDVEKLCTSIGDLYSNLSKPIIDIFLYTAKLTSSIGAQGPSFMLLYLVISGLVLTRLRRPVGRMTIKEQKLEAEFRYVNSRLITNSEEVAFYQGNRKEQSIILSTLERLIDHLRTFVVFRFVMGFADNVIGKYIATVVGYLVVSRPFLNLDHPRHQHSSHREVMEDYYQSGRMLVKMAEAIGRVVLAGRELTRLSGFTSRISELMNVLDDLNQGRYERSMVSSSSSSSLTEAAVTEKDKLRPGSGILIVQDHIIKFEHVPLVTPNGDVLVKELNFEVKSGKNVLVCGPNGCGKSSLFRILGELWPLFGGCLTKPAARELFYIPQRPYMTLGTLRDQVIYPDSQEDMLTRGVTDTDLRDTLEKVQLSYILERDGGLNAVQDFMDVLSGGEKQRIAMARLFYHRPQFAILDECTSAVSVDVEGFMYEHCRQVLQTFDNLATTSVLEHCRQVGITLFTVTHRKSLWKHHEYYLHMDGRGGFEFLPITSETVEFGS